MGRTDVGSKPSPLYLIAKRRSFGSSGYNSAMRCSSFLICDSSPYFDSYLWKNAYNGFAFGKSSGFAVNRLTEVSKATRASIIMLAA
jgi:hypothetical protein